MQQIGIIGFGKIGRAIAANMLAKQAAIVVKAVDKDKELVKQINESTYTDTEPGVMDQLSKAIHAKKLFVSADFSLVQECAAIIVAIPLLIDEAGRIQKEDFTVCIESIIPFLQNNKLLVVETSVPVGFCRHTILPLLEKKGLKHGKDFLLAYSPERIKSGSMLQQLQEIPKVMGGITGEAANKTKEFYSLFIPQKLLTVTPSVEAAELVKLAGMVYRDITIALANQLAQFSNSIEVDFASLLPLINADNEAAILQPGIGVGGHCTPVYPYFLIENFAQYGLDFTLAKQGRAINNAMPLYAYSMVKDKVKNKSALLLGLGFRPNIKEDTLSVTYLLQELLLKDDYLVRVHDTEFTQEEMIERKLNPVTDIYTSGAEVVFLLTLHEQYASINFQKLAASGVRYFVDGRNAFPKEVVASSGINYLGIGK